MIQIQTVDSPHPHLIFGSRGQDGQLLQEYFRSRKEPYLGFSRQEVDAYLTEAPAQISFRDNSFIQELIQTVQPAKVFHLAAVHHSSEEAQGDESELLARSRTVHTVLTQNILEAMRQHSPSTRFFFASSSLIFGDPVESPQTEVTPLQPVCPYGKTKVEGMAQVRDYRDKHGLFACTGILYNHESPLRSERFLSRKIIQAAVACAEGRRSSPLVIGSLSAEVDWGYAPDFVRAFDLILNLSTPRDFIVATGELHSVQEFVEHAFQAVALNWRDWVIEDANFLVRRLKNRVGNPSLLIQETGWGPSLSFAEMVTRLVEEEKNGTRTKNATLNSHL